MGVRSRVSAFMMLALLLPSAVPAAEGDAWAPLRAGAIVLFRHANAPGVGDPPGFRTGDCATQRNLSELGRRQAAAIGARFRSEGVSVGAVLTSEWCRAFDTGSIAFPGQAKTEPAFNSFFGDREREAETADRARSVLRAWKGPGTLVVFTHQVNIQALTGLFTSDAEGIVLRMQGATPEVLGRLKP